LCCHIKEFQLLFKTVNTRRFFNAVKLRISWVLSRLLQAPYIWGKPEAISIEPSTKCNLHCPECPVGNNSLKRPATNLSYRDFKIIINKTAPWCQYLSLYLQGEPFLNPEMIPMIHYAKQKNIFVATSSNGHFFDDKMAKEIVESKLDKLIISLDGTTPEVYQRYRIGGHLETVLAGIRNLIKWKNSLKSITPILIIQFVVFRHNEHQIKDMKNLVKSLGKIRLELKTAQVYNFEDKQSILPQNSVFSRYDFSKKASPHIKSNLPNHCWRSWHSGVVTVQGNWIPCCFDKDADFIMGNLLSKNLPDIWENQAYKNFRNTIFSNRQSIPMCRNCTEGLHVK